MTEVDDFRILSSWLSTYGFKVYWNKKNDDGYPVFTTKGCQRKPDLFLHSKGNLFWYDTVVEVKPPSDFEIRRGCKILDYWEDSITGKTKYFINDLEIFPKYFLLATVCSDKGKLFGTDCSFKQVKEGGSRSRAIEYGIIPKTEYVETYNFVRHLWATWRDTFNRNVTKRGGVGVLLSTSLDGNGCCPAFMYEEFNKNTNRWTQRWRGFYDS